MVAMTACTDGTEEPRLLARFRQWLSIEWMLLILWILGFAIYQMHPLNDPDTPWHVATGMYILSHHTVPTTDPFSWTMTGHPWVTQEWLFETVLAWLGVHLGFVGMWGLQVVIHAITVLALYHVAVRISKGHRVIAALTACAGTLAGLMFWTMRPQMVSYMMFAIFLWILQLVREGRFKVLWLVPPLMLIWANAHGSSTIGIFMLLLEIVISFIPTLGRFQRLRLPPGARIRLLLAAIAGAAIGLLNPNGIKAYTYALLSTNQSMTDNIMEWHSPNFHGQEFKYGVLPFLIVCFLIVIGRSRRVPIREVLYFGGAFAMMLVYQRFTPYVAIATVPLLATVLRDWGRGLLRPTRWMLAINGVLILSAAAIFGAQLPQVKGTIDQHWDAGAYPMGAVTYLKQNHLTSRLLNAYHWGGYLIYKGIPTYVDGRTDIFLQNSTFTDYLAMQNIWWNGPDLIDSYRFQAVLFPSGDQIITYLSHDPNWHVAYRDGNSEILVRNKK
jgi:hypothetical protein